MSLQRISDIGEKRLIAEFVHPFFNSSDELGGVGDDCAMLEAPNDELWLFSTDRVPADLISFRLGILNYAGLGRYLSRLNISDIAACGGEPLALLLNLGLPNTLAYEDFKALCQGFKEVAEKHGCKVLGGDISSSSEISISATSIGKVKKAYVLSRRGAEKGDTIFISRPLGITPAAFAYYLRCNKDTVDLSVEEVSELDGQFTSLEPLVSLGINLSSSGNCSSCMDNTDGVGQSFRELSVASKAKFLLKQENINIPKIVIKIADNLKEDPLELAFSAGADFSLVGTLKGQWTQKQAADQFGEGLQVIGRVEDGEGVFIETGGEIMPMAFSGWNYFYNK